jgi:hypothetical protein
VAGSIQVDEFVPRRGKREEMRRKVVRKEVVGSQVAYCDWLSYCT